MQHPDDALTAPTVVIVDDDDSVVVAAARTLKTSQLEVLTTTDPYEALDWLATRDVAVLVTDFHMPRMNGLELISAARHEQPSAVRILMTGQQTLDTAIEAINRGEIFRYVQKPFDGVKFRAVVTDALTRHRELATALAERDESLRKERYFESLELTHPGICMISRDDAGHYVVPDVCNAVAVKLLGLDVVRAA